MQFIIKVTAQINYFNRFHWSKGITAWEKGKVGFFVLYFKMSKYVI